MSTKDIRPIDSYTPCDICGRTLLRGERAEVFVAGGARHQVCELCKPRALNEGWIREGALPEYDPAGASPDRRRGVFGRRRGRRDAGGAKRVPHAVTLDDALSGDAWPAGDDAHGGPEAPGGHFSADPEPASRGGSERKRRRERPAAAPEPQGQDGRREPRHVRAVPTNTDHRIGAAVDSFNRTEHVRTISGVARSLGAPDITVTPDVARPTLVNVVVSWELCWYRYEVDLGSEHPSVRLEGQGYELSELSAGERIANAVADDSGRLHAG